MTAKLENIHDKYNIFCQKNRTNADIISLFEHFHLSLTMNSRASRPHCLIVQLCLYKNLVPAELV